MEELLRPDDVSEMLHVPVPTLYRWRYAHTGPRSFKLGRHVRYHAADVEAWLQERREEGR